MKKQLSVFALHARAAIGRLALVLLGMLALDAAAYVLFSLRGFRASLTGSELVTALRVIFSLGLVACQLRNASCVGPRSRYGNTLPRRQSTQTRGRRVWCVQLMASVGTAALHAADARYAEGAQGIFVDFYRSEFLHGLLPLADGYLWMRNVVFVLALGVLTAYMQLGLRRKNGGRRLALVVLTGLMLLVLPVGFGSGRTAGILQSAAALFAAGICGYLGFLQAHNGKEGPEDELD